MDINPVRQKVKEMNVKTSKELNGYTKTPIFPWALPPPEISPPEKTTERVLVIHDDRRIRVFFPVYFRKIGVEAVYSDNAYDAYWILMVAPFSMVLADIGIPGAWTLACYCKKQYPLKPVMLFMDGLDEDWRERMKEHAIDAWLIKPFGFFALKNKIVEISSAVIPKDKGGGR